MGTVSTSLPSDGQTIDASDVNTPINAILSEFNGNIDDNNIKSGANIGDIAFGAPENIKKIINDYNFDVRILTDTPKEFENIGCTVYEYDKKIFSYFDKFFFWTRLLHFIKNAAICGHNKTWVR